MIGDKQKNNSILKFIPENQKIDLLFFTEYTLPNGHLTNSLECQALFYYYIHAVRAYTLYVKDNALHYEDEQDSQVNFEELFKSTARLYSVDRYKMANYWELVDKQCDFINLPRLPDETRYRFNSILIM